MKKFIVLFTAVLILANSFGTSTTLPAHKLKANEVYIPIGGTGQKISLMELSTIKARDLQSLTGKKMNFAEKALFKISQKRLRASIAPDGTIDNKKLEKLFKKQDGETGFHAGGFFLGLLLWIIGVLIAYLINDAKKPARVKWAWIGFAVSTAIWLIFVLI
jgi:hypothetical protein